VNISAHVSAAEALRNCVRYKTRFRYFPSSWEFRDFLQSLQLNSPPSYKYILCFHGHTLISVVGIQSMLLNQRRLLT